MKNSLLLAFRNANRNLRRHARRSVLLIATLAFGLAAILWLECVFAGRNREMIEKVTETHVGDLQIMRDDFREDRGIPQSFPFDLDALLRALPLPARIAPRVHLPALISSGDLSFPIFLVGIDPIRERQVTRVHSFLKEGGYFEGPASDPECPAARVVLSRKMAEMLRVQLGEKLVVLSQAADGTLGNGLFRVEGIYESGALNFDKTYAFAPIDCIRRVGAIAGVHEIVIKLPPGKTSGAPVDQVRQLFAESNHDPRLSISTWETEMPMVSAVVRYNQATLLMISFMLFGIIILGMVNAQLTSVFERTRELGTMAAIGATPNQVRLQIVTEALLLGLVAVALGTALGTTIVAYHQSTGLDLKPFFGEVKSFGQYNLELVTYPTWSWRPYLRSVAGILLFILLASLYPAFRASRMSPLEAMRSF